MQSKFISDKDIILGYSGFYKEKGILNSFIRFDALFIAIQYLGFAMSGKAYMGVGRNMAYRKSLYFKKNGFTRHLGLASGDDDIFVNDNAKEHNVSVCLDATSFTRSKAKRSFSSWASQKMRHLSASSYYNRASKMSIGIEPLSRLVFYSTFLYLFFLPITWYYFVSFFIIRTILFYLVITMAAKRFNEKNIVLPALLFEIFLPIIIFILMIINKVKPKRKGSWL